MTCQPLYKSKFSTFVLFSLSPPPRCKDISVDHQALLKQFEYLNHMNPHTFEVDDLDLLIKSVRRKSISCDWKDESVMRLLHLAYTSFFFLILHSDCLGPGFSVYTVIWSMAFSGCHCSSFTSVQHKSPQRDLWPHPAKTYYDACVGERTDKNNRAKTLHNAHFLQVPFCILLYVWEFDCSLSNICICVWSLYLHSCLKRQLSHTSVFYHQQCRDSQTWTRMQCPFLASQIGWCCLTHFCCDHYYGICVIELGWTKFSSSVFPQSIIRCGHKIGQSWNLLHVHFVFPFNQATNDLENYDKERHDEFKRYEMMKEHNRREHLKTLDNDERRKEEEHYEEMKKKHADHPKINHPVSGNGSHSDGGCSGPLTNRWSSLLCLQGSQNQLKEVWEEADGLDPDDFDPKTFFKLHGRHQLVSLLWTAAG